MGIKCVHAEPCTQKSDFYEMSLSQHCLPRREERCVCSTSHVSHSLAIRVRICSTLARHPEAKASLSSTKKQRDPAWTRAEEAHLTGHDHAADSIGAKNRKVQRVLHMKENILPESLRAVEDNVGVRAFLESVLTLSA